MPDKIAKTIQAAIEKIETKISSLEDDLKAAQSDLEHKQEILKLAMNGSQEGAAK